MLKLKGKKVFTILRSKIVLNLILYSNTGDFLPISRGQRSAHSQSKIATFFPNTMSDFPKKKKVKKKKYFFFFFFFTFFFLDHYYL